MEISQNSVYVMSVRLFYACRFLEEMIIDITIIEKFSCRRRVS